MKRRALFALLTGAGVASSHSSKDKKCSHCGHTLPKPHHEVEKQYAIVETQKGINFMSPATAKFVFLGCPSCSLVSVVPFES